MYVTAAGQVFTQEEFDKMFPITDPSELIGHRLLDYQPKTKLQECLKQMLLEGIDYKLPAFRAPCMDPSEEKGLIVFKSGYKPAVGHSAAWWSETAWKEFLPSKNSGLGTDLHWAALLGNQMKFLIEEGKISVEDTWKAFCNDSRDWGHYFNSKDAKGNLEPTGLKFRKIGVFGDLANTRKILKKWEPSGLHFLLASGGYDCYGEDFPFAYVRPICYPGGYLSGSVGLLVMDP